MESEPGVLSYASPPRKAVKLQLGHLAALLGILLTFIVVGALAGGACGHLIFRPVYSSCGILLVQAAQLQNNSAISIPQVTTSSIVAKAWGAAKSGPWGNSLPASPSDAMKQATITAVPSSDLMQVQYEASDPNVAAHMANQMAITYIKAVETTSGSKLSVSIGHAPAVPQVLRNSGFVSFGYLFGGIMGTIIGIAAFMFQEPFRKGRLRVKG